MLTLDLHGDGGPGRLVVGGLPDVAGGTMFAETQHIKASLDDLRLRILREARTPDMAE